MTLAQQGQLVASFIWLLIILGPPMAVAMLAPMLYVDGASLGPAATRVRADNRANLLLLLVSFAGWIVLLKFLYLPLIGFDTHFLSFSGVMTYNYCDLTTLGTLAAMAADWIRRSTLEALLYSAAAPMLGAAVLIFAREWGRAAARPPVPHTRWR
jgi:hypothetical protein